WLSWDVWFEMVKAHGVEPKGTLRFSHYDQMIAAALDGQGIALGRSPLVDRWVKEGRLVLPFGRRFISSKGTARAYFILVAPAARSRPEVERFSSWVRADPLAVTWEDVASAAERLAGHAHRTPVMTSRTVDARTGARVFFKCENLQRIGAFKFRGAYNAVSRLAPEEKQRGILAYSSGNHAQAVALAGRELGVRVVIVMPQDAPAVKIEATRGYGAEVVLYDKNKEVREEVAERTARERGLAMIPPFDHPHVIAGQGTAAKELIEDAGALDYLFVPTSGGGLISGCAIAAARWSPGCSVIGVEPEAGDDATRSFRTKTLQTCHNPDTIADGARTH